nr:MAG TPA: hypothetical protein [Caudoviricetes sp.]
MRMCQCGTYGCVGVRHTDVSEGDTRMSSRKTLSLLIILFAINLTEPLILPIWK